MQSDPFFAALQGFDLFNECERVDELLLVVDRRKSELAEKV